MHRTDFGKWKGFTLRSLPATFYRNIPAPPHRPELHCAAPAPTGGK